MGNSVVMKNEKAFKKIIFINAFVIGAVIMALEMTGSRFLTPFFGSSVYTWASIISMVLLSLAAGYFLGGYLAEKKRNTDIISLLILLSAFSILIIPLYYESLFKWLYGFFNDPKTGGFFGALLTLICSFINFGNVLSFFGETDVSSIRKHRKNCRLFVCRIYNREYTRNFGCNFFLNSCNRL